MKKVSTCINIRIYSRSEALIFLSTDVDECVLFSPCKHGGTCLNINGGYTCMCKDGWTSTNCEMGKISPSSDDQEVSMVYENLLSWFSFLYCHNHFTSLCLPWVYILILFHSEGYKQVSSHPNIEFIYRCIVIIVLIKNFNQIFWLQKNLNWLKLTFNYTDLGSSIFAVMDESIFFSFRYWWVSKEPLLQQRKLYKFLWLVLLPLP